MEQEINTIIENNFNDMMTPTYIPERSLYYTYDNLADVPNYATHQIGQIELNNSNILHYGLGS